MNQPSIPSHIVIFSDPNDDNEALLVDTLGAANTAEVATPSGGTRVLKPARASMNRGPDRAPDIELYNQLGMAGVDLAPDRIQTLQRSDRVVKVLENSYRNRPRPVSRQNIGLGPAGAPLSPLRPLPTELPSDPVQAFLLGMKSTLDQVMSVAMPSVGPVHPSGVHGEVSWPLRMLGIRGQAGEPTGKGVKIALLDTGIDTDHPDLAHKIRVGDNAMSFVPNQTVDDTDGHGTHCAGILAGSATPSGGVRYSVAPDAELLIGRVLGPTGGYDSWILRGIAWAISRGAHIISLSLGSTPDGTTFAEQYETPARRALDRGTLFFAATGNDSQRPTFVRPVAVPANCPSICSVGAVSENSRVASYSNEQVHSYSGADVDFVAPGDEVYSSYLGGGYATLSGTSMATPHVAALAALFLQVNPGRSGRSLVDLMKAQCTPLYPHETYGSGLVQATGGSLAAPRPFDPNA